MTTTSNEEYIASMNKVGKKVSDNYFNKSDPVNKRLKVGHKYLIKKRYGQEESEPSLHELHNKN